MSPTFARSPSTPEMVCCFASTSTRRDCQWVVWCNHLLEKVPTIRRTVNALIQRTLFENQKPIQIKPITSQQKALWISDTTLKSKKNFLSNFSPRFSVFCQLFLRPLPEVRPLQMLKSHGRHIELLNVVEHVHCRYTEWKDLEKILYLRSHCGFREWNN